MQLDDRVSRYGCAFLIILGIMALLLPFARHLPKWQGAILSSIPVVAIIILFTIATLRNDTREGKLIGFMMVILFTFCLSAIIYFQSHSWLVTLIPAMLLVTVFGIAAIARKKADNSSVTRPEAGTEVPETMPHSRRLILEGLYPKGLAHWPDRLLAATLYDTGKPSTLKPSHVPLYEGEWSLGWDDYLMRLRDPNGQAVFEIELSKVHQIIELHILYAERKIGFMVSEGSLRFKKDRAAASELRAIVEKGLRSDTEYLKRLRHGAARVTMVGLGSFILGGGPFGLYCWFASWAPNPPPGHWIRWVGGFIHAALFGLMILAIGGLCIFHYGMRLWRRLARVGPSAIR
jgi:hypothetical protein